MKLNGTEKRVAQILASDATDALKISKLQNLALRTFPSSPNQKHVTAAHQALQNNCK